MIKSDLIQRISSQNPDLYQRDIEKIINAILDVTEAAEIMRSLIDRIVLTPKVNALGAELHGDLAVLARFAKEGRAECPGNSALRLSVVAAVGFENFRPGRAAVLLAGPLASFKSTSCKIQKGSQMRDPFEFGCGGRI